MDEWVWSNGGMVLTGENWSNATEFCFSLPCPTYFPPGFLYGYFRNSAFTVNTKIIQFAVLYIYCTSVDKRLLHNIHVCVLLQSLSQKLEILFFIPLADEYLQEAIQTHLESTLESSEKTQVYFSRNHSHAHNLNCITPIVTYRNGILSFIFICRCNTSVFLTQYCEGG
jgi:hypothetical protein